MTYRAKKQLVTCGIHTEDDSVVVEKCTAIVGTDGRLEVDILGEPIYIELRTGYVIVRQGSVRGV
jgi:hypothetical protein